jgi:hypothetical protein
MYDLDKTQEWLNRTIQLDRRPPIRGGTTVEPHGRRTTVLSVACAVLLMALCIGITPWIRTVGASESNVVVAEGRVQEARQPVNGPEAELAPIVASPPSTSKRLSQPRSTWIGTPLDGNIVPLPGYSPPPAPTWLDGGIRSR